VGRRWEISVELGLAPPYGALAAIFLPLIPHIFTPIYPRNRPMNRWLRCIPFAYCLVLASSVALGAVSGPLASKLEGTPPAIPEGGKSADEIKAKIKSGEIKRITRIPKVSDKVDVQLDVKYGQELKPLLLDLYSPKGIQKPVPGLIFVHGGSWSGGSRKIYGFYCQHFAEKGYVAATIDYRLSGERAFPGAVRDTKCAVRWMRANAAKLHVDPNQIALIGGSAGGHLAMLAAYSDNDDQTLQGTGGNYMVDARVQAVIDFYGPVELKADGKNPKSPVLKFMGGKTTEDARDQYEKASPINHLTKASPPTLIFHGTVDELVPVAASDMLAAKLEEFGVPYLYDRQEGWHHGMDAVEVVNARCLWFMDQFLSMVLPIKK
jgi:acetyl esterase/lipase